MPAIRVTFNKGKPDEREAWMNISDVHVGRSGYLESFRINNSDRTYTDVYLFQHGNLMDIATSIFGVATSTRSAKGLLEDFNKQLGKSAWAGRAGAAGMAIGSAAALYSFLKAKPFKHEGYYDSNDNLVLARIINAKNRSEYDPN